MDSTKQPRPIIPFGRGEACLALHASLQQKEAIPKRDGFLQAVKKVKNVYDAALAAITRIFICRDARISKSLLAGRRLLPVRNIESGRGTRMLFQSPSRRVLLQNAGTVCHPGGQVLFG